MSLMKVYFPILQSLLHFTVPISQQAEVWTHSSTTSFMFCQFFFVKLKRIEVGRLAKILYSFKSQPIWLCIYKKEILTNISWWMKFPSLIWISFACVIFKFQYLSWLINFTSTGRWFNFWGSRAGLVNSVHYRMFDLFHLLRYVAILILLFKVWSTPWSYVYIL